MTPNNNIIIISLLVLAAFFWSLNGFFIRNISSVSDMGITFFRFFLSFFLMFSWVLLTKKNRQDFIKSISKWKILIILGIIMGAFMSLNTYAYQMTNIATAQTLNSTGVFFTIILTPFLLNKKVLKKDVIGIIITFLGVIIVIGIDKISFAPIFFQGDLLALTAAFLVGIYSILVKKHHLSSNFIVNMTWIFGSGSCFVFSLSFLEKTPLLSNNISFFSFFNLLGIAFLATFLGHTILNISLKKIKPEKALTLALLSSPFSFIIGWIFFEETLTILTIIGLLLTVLGIVIILWSKKTKKT